MLFIKKKKSFFEKKIIKIQKETVAFAFAFVFLVATSFWAPNSSRIGPSSFSFSIACSFSLLSLATREKSFWSESFSKWWTFRGENKHRIFSINGSKLSLATFSLRISTKLGSTEEGIAFFNIEMAFSEIFLGCEVCNNLQSSLYIYFDKKI